MSQTELHTGKPEKSPPFTLIPPEFATMGVKRLDELAATHAELLEKVQEVNRSWVERMQSEAKLASEIATKLAAARSIPETVTIYQEWATRRMELAADDAKRLIADSQKFIETGTRLLSNGWLSNGHGGST